MKKKEEIQEETLFSVVDGEVIPMEKVADPVFSQKMMGDGFAIEPTNTEIYSPVAKGVVTSVFPTNHALGIKTPQGVEVLVHIGLDTVEIGKSAFEMFVSEGEEVNENTLLARADFEKIEQAGKGKTVIVALTNMDNVEEFDLQKTGVQTAKTAVASMKA
ncbi:PTS sugar transporter subunit IIA [Pilibacter termitis]|uniref:PTS sugar transporter subunit IIA n=1 Tax=Pilibacter termitis TaxID=263852 RepID=UPI003899F975